MYRGQLVFTFPIRIYKTLTGGNVLPAVDHIRSWVSASRVRAATVRYLGTVLVMIAAIALASLSPIHESRWIVVIIAVLGCSWFGGLGPSVVAPLLLIFSIRVAQRTGDEIFDFSSKELADLAVFLLLTTAVGWSGQIRRRAQALVRRQALQLREEAVRKDRFLAILAHELRNPLMPLYTGLELLQSAGDSPDKELLREVCPLMRRQVKHLARLVDDLLDVSRISSGKIELRRERVALGDVIQDAVDSSQSHMDAAGHELEVSIDNPALMVDADPARISQILMNLLNNAAKFTARGGRVRLSAAREGNMIEIRVRDNGIGIPRDMLPKIFEIFVQHEDSRAHSHGGLGIGLNLVRTLVELHGGTVIAHSDGAGKGSEFVVHLPISSAATSERRDLPASADPEPCHAPLSAITSNGPLRAATAGSIDPAGNT
jgi:signal transduction histidine kinase